MFWTVKPMFPEIAFVDEPMMVAPLSKIPTCGALAESATWNAMPVVVSGPFTASVAKGDEEPTPKRAFPLS